VEPIGNLVDLIWVAGENVARLVATMLSSVVLLLVLGFSVLA